MASARQHADFCICSDAISKSFFGQRHFVYLYLAGAIGGELGHMFLMPSQTVLYAASGVSPPWWSLMPDSAGARINGHDVFYRAGPIKAKHLATGAICPLRHPLVRGSAWERLCTAPISGVVPPVGFTPIFSVSGGPSFLQRVLRHHRVEAERYEQMTLEQLMSQEIDPLLEKIASKGMTSLTRGERRALARARERMIAETVARANA